MTFAAVYRDNLDYVWQALRRLGVAAQDLEDVAHEVFLVVHRRLADYDRARPLKPWLFGIAFRVASDHRRRLGKRETPDDDLDPAAASSISPERQATKREAIALASRALAAVDDDARAVFILTELDGIAVTEAAASLAIPVNTAYTRLRRARLAVASALTSATAEGAAR